jgi:UDP-N-acetylmuramoyl-tripeptide--D-alanyl-D-alanine ligase
VVVGAAAGAIHDGARQVADWGGESVLVTDQEAAVRWLQTELRTGDVVLVKASRYRTWAVADFLRDTAAGQSPAALDEVAAP